MPEFFPGGVEVVTDMTKQFPKLDARKTKRALGTEFAPHVKKDWTFYKHKGNLWNHHDMVPPHRKPFLGDPAYEVRGQEMASRRQSEEALFKKAKAEELMFQRDLALKKLKERKCERAELETRCSLMPRAKTLEAISADSLPGASELMSRSWRQATSEVFDVQAKKDWRYYKRTGNLWNEKDQIPASREHLVDSAKWDEKAIAAIETRMSNELASDEWMKMLRKARREQTIATLQERRAERIRKEKALNTYFQRKCPSEEYWEFTPEMMNEGQFSEPSVGYGSQQINNQLRFPSIDFSGLLPNDHGRRQPTMERNLPSAQELSEFFREQKGMKPMHEYMAEQMEMQEGVRQLDQFDEKMGMTVRPRLDNPLTIDRRLFHGVQTR
jgi:hypothetical protein